MNARTLIIFLLFLFSADAHSNSYEVSGFSSPYEGYNGIYTEVGSFNGKPYYRNPPQIWITDAYYIYYSSNKWWISSELGSDGPLAIENISSSDTPPTTGWQNLIIPTTQVRVVKLVARLSYSGKTFIESPNNDGTFNQEFNITHNNAFGETFAGQVGDDFAANSLVSIINLPAGLTAKVVKQSPTQLRFYIDGQASVPNRASNVDNVTLSFSDSAFTGPLGASADSTEGSTTDNIVFKFRDELTVGSTGDFDSIAEAINAALPLDIIRVDAGIYNEKNLLINKDISIIGAGAGLTIIQAAETPNVAEARVFQIESELGDVLLSDLTIRHGFFSDAHEVTQHGAGIMSQSYFKLRNCEVSHNQIDAEVGRGAGIHASMGLLMENCLIFDNKIMMNANMLGGGAGLYAIDKAMIVNSTFTENRIQSNVTDRTQPIRGGAVWFPYFFNSSFTMVNSTIANNHSEGQGGGVAIASIVLGLSAHNEDVVGVSSTSNIRIINSIVVDNSSNQSPQSSDLFFNTISTSIDIQNSITELVSSSSSLDINYIDRVIENPMLDNFGNYGGNTNLFALQADSPAINTGTINQLVPSTDQRGYRRSDTPDIGAYEFNGIPPIKVTYYANGGSGAVPIFNQTLEEGDSYIVSDRGNLTRTGYTFSGWNTTADGSGISYLPNEQVTVNSSLNLYAQWTVDIIWYAVSYTAGTGGSIYGEASQTVARGGQSSEVTAVADVGFSFLNWSDAVTSAIRQELNVQTDIAVTANFTINTYTVTFVDYDNTVLDTQTVAYQADATPPTDPTRTGYTFSGWDLDFTAVTASLTVTAQYTINTYTVTFVDYDNTVLDTQTVAYQADATPPTDPTRTGYTFSGWDLDFTAVTASLTVTAQYTINTYTVTFVDYDNTVLDTQTVAYQADATPPTDPTRTGYTFSGWDLDFTAVTASLTVTAQYTINTFDIHYIIIGQGTVSPQVSHANYGDILQFEFVPHIGYRFETASGCGGELIGALEFRTNSIISDCEITIEFVPIRKAMQRSRLIRIITAILTTDSGT